MLGITDAALRVGNAARALELFEPDDSDRPGATAETRAAKPAVSAAAPAIIQRLVNLTRASAESRSSTARDRSAFRCSGVESIIARGNQRSVRPA
jgi:hypothetical protein